jgi:hypothetical protein
MSDGITPSGPKCASSNDITEQPNVQTAFPEQSDAERERWSMADIVRPGYRLFTPGQVALATFLGGPMAGFLMLSANDARLEQRSGGWSTFWLGIVYSCFFAVAAIILDLAAPGLPLLLGLVNTFILYSIAGSMHGEACSEHKARGGKAGSLGGFLGRMFLGSLLAILVAFFVGCIGGAVLLSGQPQPSNGGFQGYPR